MSLAGELQAARDYRPRRLRCTVCMWIDGLAPEDAAELAVTFATALPTSAIYAAILRDDAAFNISRETLHRHRMGRCRGTA